MKIIKYLYLFVAICLVILAAMIAYELIAYEIFAGQHYVAYPDEVDWSLLEFLFLFMIGTITPLLLAVSYILISRMTDQFKLIPMISAPIVLLLSYWMLEMARSAYENPSFWGLGFITFWLLNSFIMISLFVKIGYETIKK